MRNTVEPPTKNHKIESSQELERVMNREENRLFFWDLKNPKQRIQFKEEMNAEI